MKTKFLKIPNFKISSFLIRISIRNKSDCWFWNGQVGSFGYGQFHINGKEYVAHRVSYDFFFGIKTNYKVIDHVCMNKLCVNPLHLREVDIRTNTLENSNCSAVAKKAQTHCIHGHEFTVKNTKVNRNGVYGGKRRSCRACANERNKAYMKRKKNEISVTV